MKLIDITDRFAARTQPNKSNGAFEPHLRVQTEREIPDPIFLAAMLGVRALRCVPVPDAVWTANEAQRDALLKAAIRDHYARCEGRVPAFGKILGYVLMVKPGKDADLGLPYDVRGNRAGPIRTVPRLGEASLSVDGQRLSQSIWREYGRDRRD